MDMLGIYRQCLDKTAKLVAGVQQDQYGLPTPCEDFDVKAVLNHLIGGNFLFAMSAEGKPLPPADTKTPDLAGNDPAGTYQTSADAAFAAFSAPGTMEKTLELFTGPMPAPMVVGIAIMEATVHGWDLAKATGQDTSIDPAVAAMILEGAKNFPADFRGPGKPFAQEISLPDDAPIGDRLVAFLGRKP